ncbi:TonB-dependent receptor [Sphingomonas jatrophae]|uniref:Iron complex outermembrane recepter protein n=1 Tax=Sphingomonas jatrophae TaxID=1166337 RepID=A0A1I6M4K9_9SPHN|nr:TonB-dependent receptor plug domain-containing protein [Sphingomonas jatrophae]SFS10620.1 iron complex outermembrane recepter protein [Sphingomonas jatrophae]
MKLHLLCGAAAACLIADGASAQEAAPPAAPLTTAAADGGAIADIVVTARRREEALQDIPLAVQAFSGDALDTQRIENATDLSKLVPALTSSQSSRDEENYVIRGQSGSGASISGQQVTVPAYFAQVPLPIGEGGGPGFYYDLQNVQVLKGPQGTLFGRNSTGGAVLFEPRRPGDDFGGYVTVEYGNYDNRGVEGALNLPVGGTLKLRVAGKVLKRDGFTFNATTGRRQDDRDFASGRASLLWEPSDRFSNILVADILRSNTNGSSNLLAAVNPAATIPTLFRGAVQAALARQQAAGPRTTFSDTLGADRKRSFGISNITTFELGDNLTLKNIFGYRRFKQLNRFDYDGSALVILNFDTCQSAATCHPADPDQPWTLNVRQFTEEFQIQGQALDNRLKYIVGVFGADVDTPALNYSHQTSVFGSVTDANQDIDDTSRAVFANVSYGFAGPLEGLTATGGYRWTHDRRALTLYQVTSGRCVTGATGTLIADPAQAAPCRADFTAKANSDAYTIGLDYKLSPKTMVYVAHRQSYRAGGTNPLAAPVLLANPPIPDALSLFSYRPETLRDVEVGLKSDFDIGGWGFRTNIASYYQWLKDAQINQTFAVGTQTVSALVNAASARIKGAEAEVTIAPTRSLSLLVAYAYTDASYGAYLDYARRDATNAPTRQSGRIFPFTPRHKLNVNGRWTLPLPDTIGTVELAANWAHKSSILLGLVPFITLPNGTNIYDGESRQKPTDTVDLTVDWRKIGGSSFDLSLFATNLFDVTYKIGGASLINSGLGINQRIYNEPRMYGASLRYSF